MPKAKVKDILTYATENRFGVAAINTLNIETVKYVIEAAERERVPIIVQFYPGFSDYTDLKHLAFAACDMAEKASVPVGAESNPFALVERQHDKQRLHPCRHSLLRMRQSQLALSNCSCASWISRFA